MTFNDFKINNGSYFVAMEYYRLIWNRTFIVLVTEQSLIGIKVNGVISAEGGDGITRAITRKLAVKNDLDNPLSYVKDKYIQQLDGLDLLGDDLFKQYSGNFRISYKDINSLSHNSKKKWGMGYYPHDGKVYVRLNNGKLYEYIILGNQSGKVIKETIESRL